MSSNCVITISFYKIMIYNENFHRKCEEPLHFKACISARNECQVSHSFGRFRKKVKFTRSGNLECRNTVSSESKKVND